MAPASDSTALISLKSLPLGFRFRPTDEELINHYLKRKINGRIDPDAAAIIPVVDVCKFEPWDLKHKSPIQSDDLQWFFFAERDRKYSSGQRTNRATKEGYWKATGKDRKVKSRNGVKGGSLVVVGMKRTLVFHRGRAPKGKRTCWIMHEYRTIQEDFESSDKGGYVVCRLFEKTEEQSSDSSPKTDEIEKNTNSPTLSGASNQKNDLEEVVKLSSEKSPELHYNEEKGLPAASKQESVPQCNNNIVLNSADRDDVEVMGEVDSLLNATIAENQQLGFSDIFPPVHPCNDYSLLDNYNSAMNCMSHDVEKAEDDSMTEFLAAVLRNEEEYSPEVSSGHAEQFANIVPSPPAYDLDFAAYSPRESIHAKESASSRDLENEGAFPQDLCSFKDSDWSYDPYFPSKNYLQSLTVKRSIHSNQNVQHRGLNVPAADSIQSHNDLVEVNNQEILNDRGICYARSGMESCNHQIVQNSLCMDKAISTKKVDENAFSSVGKGITIRSYQPPQHHSENAVLKQGDAFRRFRLQKSFHIGSLLGTITNSSSSNQADLQDEVSSVEDGQSAESYITGEEVSESSYENKPFCCAGEDKVSSNVGKEDDPQLTCRPNNAGFRIGSIFVNLKNRAPVLSSKIFATCNTFVSMAYLPLMLAILVPCIVVWWNSRRVSDRPI